MYQSSVNQPLMRVEWNKIDSNVMSTFLMGSNQAILMDLRRPLMPLHVLKGHSKNVNSISWSPHCSNYICSSGDDGYAFIWDFKNDKKSYEHPDLGYLSKEGISGLEWSRLHNDYISFCLPRGVRLIKV